MKPLITALVLSTTGCALMTTKGPVETSGRIKPHCTAAQEPMRFDLAAGTIAGLLGLVGGIKLTNYHEPAGNSVIVLSIATFAGFYGSAAIGFVRAKRCRDAINEWNFRATDPIEDEDATDN